MRPRGINGPRRTHQFATLALDSLLSDTWRGRRTSTQPWPTRAICPICCYCEDAAIAWMGPRVVGLCSTFWDGNPCPGPRVHHRAGTPAPEPPGRRPGTDLERLRSVVAKSPLQPITRDSAYPPTELLTKVRPLRSARPCGASPTPTRVTSCHAAVRKSTGRRGCPAFRQAAAERRRFWDDRGFRALCPECVVDNVWNTRRLRRVRNGRLTRCARRGWCPPS
jgi:hypothetical protein